MRARNRVHVQCAHCGADIERTPSTVSAHNFCDIHCRAAWQSSHFVGQHNPHSAPKTTLICEVCQSPFLVTPCDLERRYCSKKCTDIAKGGSVEVPCHHCGKMLVRQAHRLRVAERQFCDATCRGAWSSGQTGDAAPAWKGTQVTVECEQCGAQMQRDPTKVRRNSRFFCCRSCYTQWKPASMRGEANWAWKGGNRPKYYGPNWFRQMRAARERDRYRCQICGAAQQALRKALDVHHIVPFRDFGYIPGENDNYLDANRLENLICLCAACHKRAESGTAPFQTRLFSPPE